MVNVSAAIWVARLRPWTIFGRILRHGSVARAARTARTARAVRTARTAPGAWPRRTGTWTWPRWPSRRRPSWSTSPTTPSRPWASSAVAGIVPERRWPTWMCPVQISTRTGTNVRRTRAATGRTRPRGWRGLVPCTTSVLTRPTARRRVPTTRSPPGRTPIWPRWRASSCAWSAR